MRTTATNYAVSRALWCATVVHHSSTLFPTLSSTVAEPSVTVLVLLQRTKPGSLRDATGNGTFRKPALWQWLAKDRIFTAEYSSVLQRAAVTRRAVVSKRGTPLQRLCRPRWSCCRYRLEGDKTAQQNAALQETSDDPLLASQFNCGQSVFANWLLLSSAHKTRSSFSNDEGETALLCPIVYFVTVIKCDMQLQ